MSHSNNVLVIGATGGVGYEVAKTLSGKGYYVYATCRTKAQGKTLESEGVCHHALQMDLSKSPTIVKAFEQLDLLGVNELSASINCAAITQAAPLELMDETAFKDIFQVNVFGTLKAIQLAIPLLRRGQGRLILVGSVGGSLVVPMLGAYSASKFALEAITDALRRELAPWKIHVSLVKPGVIKTDMTRKHIKELEKIVTEEKHGVEKNYVPLYKSHKRQIAYGYENGVTPMRVAEDVIEAFEAKNPKTRYLVGIEPTIVTSISRLFPDKLQDKILEQMFPEK